MANVTERLPDKSLLFYGLSAVSLQGTVVIMIVSFSNEVLLGFFDAFGEC